MIDLHVHSNKSDGTFSPSELVSLAAQKGISSFALTDHDSIDGLPEALQAAGGTSVTVIPGIEFSTDYEGQDVHILGLYLDYKNPAFVSSLQDFLNSRQNRNIKMCKKLTEAGFPVTYEELEAAFPNAVITRAHYARFMMERGFTKSLPEAFERYIGDRCPCYVPREKVSPEKAVELTLAAKGVPILAHPVLYHMSDYRLDRLVAGLVEHGLAGIEAIYSTYTNGETVQMKSLASHYGLCISGGSDFHGLNKPKISLGTGLGNLSVPDELLTDIQKKIPQ